MMFERPFRPPRDHFMDCQVPPANLNWGFGFDFREGKQDHKDWERGEERKREGVREGGREREGEGEREGRRDDRKREGEKEGG